VTLDVDGNRRQLGYGALGPGAIQVEFGRLPDGDELAADDDLPDEAPDADDDLDDEMDEFGDNELDDEELDDELEDEAKLGAGGDGH
jgi:hypothetical protein